MDQGTPKHRWTAEQRDTLAVLERFYDISSDERRDVFNKFYAKELNHEGFDNGLTTGAVVSQVADLRQSPRGKRFRHFGQLDFQQALRSSRLVRNKIEAVAASMDIELRPVAEAANPTSRSRQSTDSTADSETETPTKRRRVTFDQRGTYSASERSLAGSTDSDTSCSGSSWQEASDESSLDGFEDGPVENEEDRVFPKLRVRRDYNGKKVPTRPRLLFRAFRPSHGLQARRFLTNSTPVSCPPKYGSQEFRDSAYCHLSSDETFNSPWLSFTEYLSRALKIMAAAKHELHLAVIDYNEVEESLKSRFGIERDKIWLVPTLCKDLKNTDERFGKLRKIRDENPMKSEHQRNYTGTGEFIIWGAVPNELVAELTNEAIYKLLGAMELVKELRYDSGLLLGSSIDDIPYRYKEIFAYAVIRAFEVEGYSQGIRHREFENFVQGIYRERCSRSLSVFSTGPEGSPCSEESDTSGWRGWSHATTPDVPFRPRPRPRKVIVQTPPLRDLMVRDYASAPIPPLKLTEKIDDDESEMQQMLDQQLAEEEAEYCRDYWR
ncbi:hypothetical protein LTR84_009382 [Exophiala bonariae]|uniref:DUF7587 domain-containing protein n=1 Tax=Exophiala bonariae TaxID=1690606 RepID=A0AAV9MV45_9EURO|nr:hypothetical protein LTR84_009382 [Exophiala bonariae]